MIQWIMVGVGAAAGLGLLIRGITLAPPFPASLQYLTVTSTGLQNTPPVEIWDTLRYLDRQIKKLISAFGPMVITSGYRSPAVNEAVGGVDNSLHLSGRAIDFRFRDEAKTMQLWESWAGDPSVIAGLVEELILHVSDVRPSWLHIGFAIPGLAPSPRIERVTVTGGQTLSGCEV